MAQMQSQLNIGSYITTGVGRGTEAYGAWYEGEQAKDYYKTMQSLTIRQKKDAQQAIAFKRDQAFLIRADAADAYREAEDIERRGELQQDAYQKETDKGISEMIVRLAKSGVALEGSPMDYIDEVVTERAKGLGIMQWENQREVYKAESRGAAIINKSTIMLRETKLATAGLDMFNYQYQIYKNAESEAAKSALWGQFNAFLGAFADSFAIMGGGQASQSGYGTAQTGNSEAGNMGDFQSADWSSFVA